tara:strand:- start:487 stop:1023 length:537 start_codon:yes stop_codon:yes gene_type:complete
MILQKWGKILIFESFIGVRMGRENSNLENELEDLIELRCLADEYIGKNMENYEYNPSLKALENKYNTKNIRLISHYRTQEVIGNASGKDCFLEDVSNFAEKKLNGETKKVARNSLLSIGFGFGLDHIFDTSPLLTLAGTTIALMSVVKSYYTLRETNSACDDFTEIYLNLKRKINKTY